MEKMGLNEIRTSFLEFFKTKDHLVESSYSLVPQNDKSLLLIAAGMAPLKNYFMGTEIPPHNRMATCQKCIRTGDIENVGHTSRHATFFEMLGNFSFGDYFKEESIAWGWEYVTEHLKLPLDKLWVTVYLDDDEAYDIWKDQVGVPEERIVRLGKADNFWEIGTGPCGPCSEIYFDRGEKYSCGLDDCKPGCDCDRYVEFWNHVFTQFDKDEDGNYNPLENPNIDTGMGLERIACIMQGVESIFEVDTIKHILDRVSEITNTKYGEDHKKDISLRIITDHIRAVTFMVSDGIMPNNEGRGYVLRRLLRRAARHGKLLGVEGNFLTLLVDEVINVSGHAYPDLVERQDYIKKIISIEEDRFQKTIDSGLSILNGYIDALKVAGSTELSGEDAFKLYDTYGFPLDLTVEILEEHAFTVDHAEFEQAMEDQRNRARNAIVDKDGAAWTEDPLAEIGKDIAFEFVGYAEPSIDTKVLAIIKNNQLVDTLVEGEEGTVVIEKSPFYAESGGQTGDKGTLNGTDTLFDVADTRKGFNGIHLHKGQLITGNLTVGSSVVALINKDLRRDTAKNHTTTHMLHRALKNVLGDHVEQAGSLVDPHKLRFDFTHYQAMTAEEIKAVEKQVNEVILSGFTVATTEETIEAAKAKGATALFGEKYGNTVRVVEIKGYSMELCGGTHLTNSLEAGLFKIVSEGGVAAGIRRIEGITGREVYQHMLEQNSLIETMSEILKAPKSDLETRAQHLMEEQKALTKEIEGFKAKEAGKLSENILETAESMNGFNVVIAKFPGLEMDAVRMLGDKVVGNFDKAIAVFAVPTDESVTFLIMASPDAINAGAHAGNIIKEVAKVAKGGGGGRPNMAQAGGKDATQTDAALAKAKEIIMSL
ncbi:MAG: alanine--tRNA ligase [Clostridia bacterium]|nr:alanine--tRNA ligase [Clostridia bacterium]